MNTAGIAMMQSHQKAVSLGADGLPPKLRQGPFTFPPKCVKPCGDDAFRPEARRHSSTPNLVGS